MTNVLVTGGSGFIGKYVSNELIKQGYNPICYDIYDDTIDGATFHFGSILDMNELRIAMTDCDYVVHLAAMLGVKRTDTKKLSCLDINIQGSVNVFETSIKLGVERVVFSSSSEVYGDQSVIPITEENPVNPKSIYGVSKITGEKYLEAYNDTYGMNYNIVRFFNIYGPNQVAEFVVPRFVYQAKHGQDITVYGKGNQIRAFCYVVDAARGLVKTLNSKESNQIFNIGNDTEPITIKNLAKKIIDLADTDSKIRQIPLEKSDRSENREIVKRIPSIEKIKSKLNYSPQITLEEGIGNTIETGVTPTRFEPTIVED